MENAMEKMNNLLNKKEIVNIEILGTCDKNGLLVQNLNFPVKLNQNVSHKISLVSLETTSFFPNVTSSNNKFYYSVAADTEETKDGVKTVVKAPVKEVTITDGAYEIKQYNEAVQSAIEANGDVKDNITISLNESTAMTSIVLKGGYRVYFDKANTWRDVLGFDGKVLNTNGSHSF